MATAAQERTADYEAALRLAAADLAARLGITTEELAALTRASVDRRCREAGNERMGATYLIARAQARKGALRQRAARKGAATRSANAVRAEQAAAARAAAEACYREALARARATERPMSAHYPGRCTACRAWVVEGTAIYYDHQARSIRHQQCPPRAPTLAPTPTPAPVTTAPDLCLTCGASWPCEHRAPVGDADARLRFVALDGPTLRQYPAKAAVAATAAGRPASPRECDACGEYDPTGQGGDLDCVMSQHGEGPHHWVSVSRRGEVPHVSLTQEPY